MFETAPGIKLPFPEGIPQGTAEHGGGGGIIHRIVPFLRRKIYYFPAVH